MMNADQINSYLEAKHAAENTSKVDAAPANAEETKVQETDTVEVPEDKTTAPKADTGSEVEKKDEVEAQPAETKPEDKAAESDEKHNKSNPQKKEYTQQEKIDYAFQKEKAKRKKLEARIKELEEENKKFKDLKLEDFKNNNEAYVGYLVDQKTRENEKKRLEAEYQASKVQEAEQINKQRIAECFPDEAEQAKYNDLVAKNGADFVKKLDEADPEQVVLGFLDDSKVAPLLIRIMMTNKEYRDEVLSKSSPYGKQRAMERLEEKVLWAKQQLANKAKKQEAPAKAPAAPAKPSIPVVGSVTQSDSSNGPIVKDYNSILRDLNNRRRS